MFLFTERKTNALTDHVACQSHTADQGKLDPGLSLQDHCATPNSQKHVTQISLYWAIFIRHDSEQLAYLKTGNKQEQQQKRGRLLKNKFK